MELLLVGRRWQTALQDHRHIARLPTKTAARKAAKPLRDAVENQVTVNSNTPTVSTLIEQYRKEKMPQRYSTSRCYELMAE